MKIALIKENSGWILDEIAEDYKTFTRHEIVRPEHADLIWAINPWGFGSISSSDKFKVLQLHHIDETKIDAYDFNLFEKADIIITPNKNGKKTIQKYLSRQIYVLPYWIISKRCEKNSDKVDELRKKVLGNHDFLIGSFQKDSEGKTDNPKLSKGPDTFLEVVKRLKEENESFKVVLSGYNRRYIINGLEENGIPYEYFERHDNINDLYDILDWYLVTSRTEGGPQALLEASLRDVNVLSTDCGMADQVLHPACICKDVEEFAHKIMIGDSYMDYNRTVVMEDFSPTTLIKRYDDFFEDVYNRRAK